VTDLLGAIFSALEVQEKKQKIKKAKCRKVEDARCRKYGDLENGRVRRWTMNGGVHGPGVSEL